MFKDGADRSEDLKRWKKAGPGQSSWAVAWVLVGGDDAMLVHFLRSDNSVGEIVE
jgi:hypothetical protein